MFSLICSCVRKNEEVMGEGGEGGTLHEVVLYFGSVIF